MHYGRQQHSQYKTRRSVAETLIESLSQSGLTPSLNPPAASRRPRRAQRLGIVGMLLLGLAAAGFVVYRASIDPRGPLAEARPPVAVWEMALGTVAVAPVDGAAPASLLTARPGEPIHAGSTITTTGLGAGGAPSRAALRLAGGQSMRLDAGTRVRVASATRFTLERGAVYFDAAGGAALEVRTTLGVVRDVGTQFEVRWLEEDGESTLRVRVREGAVILEGDSRSRHAVGGEELTLAADGSARRGESPIFGSQWDWVVDTATAPDLVDQPLQAFLDWASREGGWKVRFADDATATAAARTVLHGELEGLSLREASRVVFSGSGLDYRLERGALIVGPGEQQGAR